MANLNPQAQALLVKYGNETGVTPDQIANLTAVINSSPPLIDQINEAVKNGHLKGFEPLPSGTNAGGQYHPDRQIIKLPSSILTTTPGSAFDMAEPAFVLGHELEHGFNRLATRTSNETFLKELVAEAKKPLATHDYTQEIDKKIAQNRRDESGAEIAGWNAMAGQAKALNPNATLEDIYKANRARAADFVDLTPGNPPSYALKSNLTINPDLSISQTPANIEAMGVNYFDKTAKAFNGPVAIGHHGNSDYTNYYATTAIGKAAEVDSLHAKAINGVQPQMAVNMQQLGLSEQLLEQNGIDLGKKNSGQKAYLDISTNPPTSGVFQHTIKTHQHVNPILRYGLDSDREQPDQQVNNTVAPMREHPFFSKALSELDRLGPSVGGYRNQQEKESVAAELALAAQKRPLADLTGVVPSNDGVGLIPHWINPNNKEDRDRAYVDKTQAAQQDIGGTLQKLETVTQEVTRANELANRPDPPTLPAPSLSR